MSLTFRAAVLRNPRTALSVEQVSFRGNLQNQEVLVKLAASGTCGSDAHVISGDWAAPLPMVLGHEGAGEIVEIGKNVTRVHRHDHVVLSWTPSCGHCEFCVKGRPVLCDLANRTAYKHLSYDGTTRLCDSSEGELHSFLGVGSFGEYAMMHEDAVVPIRSDAPLAQASLVGCAVTTGIGAVVNTANVNAGNTVLVVGCGGVGLNIIQGARLVGASIIIAADTSDRKLTTAKMFGATHTINTSVDCLRDVTLDITHGRGTDFAFEAVGLAKTIEDAYSCIARGGTMVVVGQVADDVIIKLNPFVISDQEKRIIGSNYGSCITSVDFRRIFDLYMEGKVDLDSLVTKRVSLDNINEAFADMQTGKGIRTVVEYS